MLVAAVAVTAMLMQAKLVQRMLLWQVHKWRQLQPKWKVARPPAKALVQTAARAVERRKMEPRRRIQNLLKVPVVEVQAFLPCGGCLCYACERRAYGGVY